VVARTWVLVVVAACGSQAAGTSPSGPAPAATAKLPDGPPLVAPHEHMSYRLALGGMDLATYDLAAGDITEVAGRRAIVVQSHARTRGLAKVLSNVDDTFTSWIDVETGRSLRWIVQELNPTGGILEKTDARIADRADNVIPVDVWLDDQPPNAEPQRVSMTDVWDYNAFLIAVRGWEAPAGSTVTAEVFRSRYLWNVTITIRGKEKLVTELGEYPTLRFDARAYRLDREGKRTLTDEERAFSIWITDDQDRVPVQTVGRTDYGDIKLTIVDYQPGTR
jgi:hypothetical protein